MQNLKKTLSKLGTQKDVAKMLGISLSYYQTLIYCNQKIPIKLAKKIIELSDGQISLEQLRPDLGWIGETKERKEEGRKNVDNPYI